MSILEHPGLALYSIPIVWGLGYIPALMKIGTIMFSIGYDNVNPRGNIERLPEPVVAARVKRMEGAHQNGLEAFPLWLAAVLAGIISRVDVITMNRTAIVYMVLRAAFLLVYVIQKSNWQSYLRTFIWAASTGVAFSLLFKAAGNLGS